MIVLNKEPDTLLYVCHWKGRVDLMILDCFGEFGLRIESVGEVVHILIE